MASTPERAEDRADAEHRAQRLLDAATQLFAEHGFRRVTVRDHLPRRRRPTSPR